MASSQIEKGVLVFWFAAVMVICCALMMGMWRRALLPFGPLPHPVFSPFCSGNTPARYQPRMGSGVDHFTDHTGNSVKKTDPVAALQQDYVEGRISVEAYEQELDAIFRREGAEHRVQRD